MSYLKKLGFQQSNYVKHPSIEIKGHHCWTGWLAIAQHIIDSTPKNGVIAIECYSGILDEVLVEIKKALHPSLVIETEKDLFKSKDEIDQICEPYLGGDDPIFGYMTRLKMEDFLLPEARAITQEKLSQTSGLRLVYGPGASIVCSPDTLIYADMPRWEGQLRQRRNEVDNLGVHNRELKASLQYKRSFFIDWRVCDKLKRESFDQWNFLLDTCDQKLPKLIRGDTFRAAMDEAVSRPFRLVPFFDPGVWGGKWIQEVCAMPDDVPNYAWGFDCVPEENSLLLDINGTKVEIPSINLVFYKPKELLGEPVYGRYGAEFPIRFDLLDTMQGQNLSFQVHPLVDYAREHFGLSYTQDESYYILDADAEAKVYLGLKEDVDPVEMMRDLALAQADPDKPFPDAKHVATFAAKKHDHFLIPAGTCHCSGSGSMVLEISHTPYIFTLKLWDWARLDLNGLPRPINLERGQKAIQWDRRKKWVENNLVNQVELIAEGNGWREEKTGLYKSEAFETRRHWFTQTVLHDTGQNSVHVLNLVEGEEAIVESPIKAFAPFIVHYAETFIIPAAVGPYTIRPHGASIGKECATIKAFLRVNA